MALEPVKLEINGTGGARGVRRHIAKYAARRRRRINDKKVVKDGKEGVERGEKP